jgi:hypothetical protein
LITPWVGSLDAVNSSRRITVRRRQGTTLDRAYDQNSGW